MEHLAHVDAVSDELGACCLDVIDDEEQFPEPSPARRS